MLSCACSCATSDLCFRVELGLMTRSLEQFGTHRCSWLARKRRWCDRPHLLLGGTPWFRVRSYA